jgi:hypothetical protein
LVVVVVVAVAEEEEEEDEELLLWCGLSCFGEMVVGVLGGE